MFDKAVGLDNELAEVRANAKSPGEGAAAVRVFMRGLQRRALSEIEEDTE